MQGRPIRWEADQGRLTKFLSVTSYLQPWHEKMNFA